jgi:hypothetical protein
MNHQRLQIMPPPQFAHGLALRPPQSIRPPLPRTGRENLKSIAPQPIRPLRCILHPACNRSMNPNSPRSPRRMLPIHRPPKRIFFRKLAHPNPTHEASLEQQGKVFPASVFLRVSALKSSRRQPPAAPKFAQRPAQS